MELLEVELLLVLLLFLLLLLPPLFLLVVVFLLVFPEPPLVFPEPPLVLPPLVFPLPPFCAKSASTVVFRVIIVSGVHTSPASVLNSFRKL